MNKLKHSYEQLTTYLMAKYSPTVVYGNVHPVRYILNTVDELAAGRQVSQDAGNAYLEELATIIYRDNDSLRTEHAKALWRDYFAVMNPHLDDETLNVLIAISPTPEMLARKAVTLQEMVNVHGLPPICKAKSPSLETLIEKSNQPHNSKSGSEQTVTFRRYLS